MTKLLPLFFIFALVGCSQSGGGGGGKKKSSSNKISSQAAPRFTSVCKMETASNFESRSVSGNVTFLPDNSLCKREVCSREYTPLNLELLKPAEAQGTCSALESNVDYQVTLTWHADDAAEVWLDGAMVGTSNDWYQSNQRTFTVKGGCHTLAIKAVDLYQVSNGLLATLKVNNQIVWRSGESNDLVKVAGPQDPAADWTLPEFDDRDWESAQTCSNVTPWLNAMNGQILALNNDGAEWIWGSADCQTISNTHFRINFAAGEALPTVHNESMCAAP